MSLLSKLNWRLVLLFAVSGPLVGAAYLLLGVVHSIEIVGNLDRVALFFAWSYAFGTVLAVLTGLLLPYVISLLPHAHRVWLQLIAAAFVGFVITWTLFTTLTPFNAMQLAVLGGISAVVCAVIGLLFRVGPNNSLKQRASLHRPHGR